MTGLVGFSMLVGNLGPWPISPLNMVLACSSHHSSHAVFMTEHLWRKERQCSSCTDH